MAKSVNSWHGIGNLTKDPELKYVSSGTAVASFSIACNEKYKKDDEWKERVEYVNVKAWGRLGEIAGEYLKKGKQVYISGPLRTDSWDDKTTGQKRYSTYINASDLVLMSNGSNSKPEVVSHEERGEFEEPPF